MTMGARVHYARAHSLLAFPWAAGFICAVPTIRVGCLPGKNLAQRTAARDSYGPAVLVDDDVLRGALARARQLDGGTRGAVEPRARVQLELVAVYCGEGSEFVSLALGAVGHRCPRSSSADRLKSRVATRTPVPIAD